MVPVMEKVNKIEKFFFLDQTHFEDVYVYVSLLQVCNRGSSLYNLTQRIHFDYSHYFQHFFKTFRSVCMLKSVEFPHALQ